MDNRRFVSLLTIGEDAPVPAEDERVRGLVALSGRMGKPPPDRDAPPREVMARLGDSWSALILLVLATGTYRHATLKRVIAALSAEGDISQRMLTLRLRALERDGFVLRETQDDLVPPRVAYSLSPLGNALADQLKALLEWIEAQADTIEAARARFTG